jgi:CDGSH iron-sulfur domain-containing protein 3
VALSLRRAHALTEALARLGGRARRSYSGTIPTSVGREAVMSTPRIAQKAPYEVQLEAGKTYYWCACGESKTQPFCDGSHKTTSFTPIEHVAKKTATAWLCGCKQSARSPLCDGTHNNL